jgi:hypothetical protein
MPPQPLERSNPPRHTPSLEGEAEPIRHPVQAGHPRLEGLTAGGPRPVDQHEPMFGDREEPHGVPPNAKLVLAVLRALHHDLLFPRRRRGLPEPVGDELRLDTCPGTDLQPSFSPSSRG